LLGPGYVPGTRWLDLFAGTGQVGIEALSRGAAEAVFLDTNRQAVRIIHDNLQHTELTAGAQVLRMDAFAYLREGPVRPFDVIYVAPPQYQQLWSKVLRRVDARPGRFLKEDGIVVVQIDPREYQEPVLERLELFDQRTYGNTMLSFYEVGEEGGEDADDADAAVGVA